MAPCCTRCAPAPAARCAVPVGAVGSGQEQRGRPARGLHFHHRPGAEGAPVVYLSKGSIVALSASIVSHQQSSWLWLTRCCAPGSGPCVGCTCPGAHACPAKPLQVPIGNQQQVKLEATMTMLRRSRSLRGSPPSASSVSLLLSAAPSSGSGAAAGVGKTHQRLFEGASLPAAVAVDIFPEPQLCQKLTAHLSHDPMPPSTCMPPPAAEHTAFWEQMIKVCHHNSTSKAK